MNRAIARLRSSPQTEIRVRRGPSRKSSVSPGRMAAGTFSGLPAGRTGPAVSAIPTPNPRPRWEKPGRPSCARDRDAVDTLGGGLTRHRAPRGAGDHLRGVDDDLAPDDVDPEAVEAAGCGAAAVLAVDRVLRSVARTLEPLCGVAERNAAAQVDALAVEGDEAALGSVRRDVGGGLGGGPRAAPLE